MRAKKKPAARKARIDGLDSRMGSRRFIMVQRSVGSNNRQFAI